MLVNQSTQMLCWFGVDCDWLVVVVTSSLHRQLTLSNVHQVLFVTMMVVEMLVEAAELLISMVVWMNCWVRYQTFQVLAQRHEGAPSHVFVHCMELECRNSSA